MLQFLLKTLVTAVVIVAVSELGKKSAPMGAILAALPLTSLMAMLWLYADTRDPAKVADLSIAIFWAVLPSFIFFLSLPWLLRSGVRFAAAMPIACGLMVLGYGVYVWVLRKAGVAL